MGAADAGLPFAERPVPFRRLAVPLQGLGARRGRASRLQFAGIDAEVPRLRLIDNGQLVLLAVLMLVLLQLIFPQRTLGEKLHD